MKPRDVRQYLWDMAEGCRANILIHGYDQVQDDIVWDTVARDVPSLKAEVEALLRERG